MDSKLTKKAIAHLKRIALKAAKQGKRPRATSTGSILEAFKIPRSFDHRSKAYREMLAGLNHAAEIGLISQRYYGSPKSFVYRGPEVEEAIEAYDKEQKEREKSIHRIVRERKLRSAVVHPTRISLSYADFVTLYEAR